MQKEKAWYEKKNRQMDQVNIIESPEIYSQNYHQLNFDKGTKTI